MHQYIKAIFFDLDGTLVDTAPDMALALNLQLAKHNKEELAFEQIRPYVSHGVAALLKIGFGLNSHSANFEKFRVEYLEIYRQNLAIKSALFPGLKKLLDFCKGNNILWGIVTNKPEFLAKPLVKALGLAEQSVSLICGDTVKPTKPSPKPLFVACQQASILPVEAIYVGDALRDIASAKAAGMLAISAEYGYIQPEDKVENWGADINVQQSEDLLSLIKGFFP